MQMNKLFSPLAIASTLFLSGVSSAATSGSAYGLVGELSAGGIGVGAASQNLMYFTIKGNYRFASCANSSSPHFVINSENGGKTMVSLLLTAKAAGKKIHVAGRGTCTAMAGHEDVSLIYLD